LQAGEAVTHTDCLGDCRAEPVGFLPWPVMAAKRAAAFCEVFGILRRLKKANYLKNIGLWLHRGR